MNVGQPLEQILDSLAGCSRDSHGVGVFGQVRRGRDVDLVERRDDRTSRGADVAQRVMNDLDLALEGRIRKVDHVDQDVGFHRFFQRSTEGLDEPGWEDAG